MKILKKALWIFAGLNLLTGIAAITSYALTHIGGKLTGSVILNYIFNNAYHYLMYAAPVIIIAGMIITAAMICKGLKKGATLKEECLLLGTFALSALPWAYLLGLSIMSV